MTTDATAPLSLPGQAAAPAGPIDLTMMYLLHHGFRRDLARFASAARHTPLAETATWTALLARWDLFALLLHDHHEKEDHHVWPLLRRAASAAGDREGLLVLEEMEAEHALIDPLLDSVRDRLLRLASGPHEESHAELVELTAGARDSVDAHLAHEERSAIPLLQAHVAVADWEELDRTALRGGLSPAQLLQLVPWAVHGLPDSVTREPLRRAGLPFRVLLRIGRPRFARLEREAFVHVPEGVGV
jgi:hemerythrin-like domain-containing protein